MRKTVITIIVAMLILLVCDTTYANLTATEGLAIDLSSAGAGTDMTIAFDPTELLGNQTWGDASTDTIVWTWNRASGTDPTITFNSGSIGLQALTLTTDLIVAEGGTGASTFTDGGPLLGSGAGAITAMSVLGDGEIIIGDGTTDPVALDVGSSTSITILGTIATGVWEGTAIADGYIPNAITIDLATLATTVTVEDETTDTTCFPLFGTAVTGSLGAKTAASLTFNSNTGSLGATEFVGGGAGLTAIDAATGDSATDFFDAGAFADARIPDNITIDLATLATTVTITDNEDTAENNPLVFVAGADPDGGSLGLETDGTCYYTPSTGVITTTGFAGALTGNASTATLAATVTYADNEDTAENNAVVFLPGGDLDGGNLAPEVDGDFHYNPSTGTVTATIFKTATNIKDEPKHMIFTIIDPLATQTEDNEVCIWPVTPAALTVTKIVVTLDSAANEVAGDLKWADAFIGLAGATVINVFDTSSGVLSDDSITAGAVEAGKCMYIAFDSAPNTAIKQMCVDITWDFD